MKYDPITRRFFLQGLGGSLLALPLLTSLIPRSAQAATLADQKFLVIIGSDHGGTGFEDWYPAPVVSNSNAGVLSQRNLFSSMGANEIPHQIRHGLLKNMLTANPGHPGGNVDAGQARLSFILGRSFNPYLDKMNFYRGIDAGMFYSGHSHGIPGGNLKEAVNAKETTLSMESWPTLDQFLAHSNKFYTDTSGISNRVIVLGNRFSWLPDGTRASSFGSRIDQLYGSLFDKYENNQTPAAIAARERKTYLVDRVYEDYRRFTRGAYGPARQLAAADKQRVEQHVAYLADIQTKYQNIVNSCSDVSGPNTRITFGLGQLPNGLSDLARVYDMANDLIVAAFQCGASRLASITLGVTSTYPDYHNSVAHGVEDPAMRLVHSQNFRWQAEHVVANLVKKMAEHSAVGDGQSILDRALVNWTHESGYQTHQHDSLGLITFGSLNGFFKTGNYVDYRNLDNMGIKVWKADSPARPGIPIQRFHANIIQGMGFSPAEYERNGRPGYGDSSVNEFPKGSNRNHLNHIAYPKTMTNSLSDRLPIVT